MDENDPEITSPELQEVAAQLRCHRATATPSELERIRLTARTQAGRPAPRRISKPQGGFMRSRIAVTALLAVGVVMSSAGATLAVSGIAGGDDDSAAGAQYDRTPPPPDDGGTLPEDEDGVGGDEAPPLGDEDTGGSDPQDEIQPGEQVASDGDERLPFTGLAAIPLLGLGAGLLVTGVMLNRASGRRRAG